MSKFAWRMDCYSLLVKPATCEHCDEQKDVELHYSRTAYHDKRMFPDEYNLSQSRWLNIEVDLPKPTAELGEAERKLDPNAPHWLCSECRTEDVEFWDSQWEEYYRERL